MAEAAGQIQYYTKDLDARDAGGYVLEANQGNPPGAHLGESCRICTVCNQAFPVGRMKSFRGKWYCVPNGDYKDIASILKLEGAKRYRPAGLGNERVVPPIIRG